MKTNRSIMSLLILTCASACSNSDSPTPPSMQAEPEPQVMQTTITNRQWQVEDIDQEGVIDNSMITIEFPEEGRVGGRGGCNPYFGGVSINGDSIGFTGLGSGMKACPEAIMRQEARFFAVMSDVARFEIENDVLLFLIDADGNRRIRAVQIQSAVEEKPVPLDLPSETWNELNCGDAVMATWRFVGPETIELKFADRTLILVRERTASGAKYVGKDASFWNKGEEVMIEIEGEVHRCRLSK